MHDNHEIWVWAKEWPLKNSWSESKPCLFLEYLEDCFKLREECFQLFQREREAHDLVLTELLQESAQIVSAGRYFCFRVQSPLIYNRIQRHIVKLVLKLFIQLSFIEIFNLNTLCSSFGRFLISTNTFHQSLVTDLRKTISWRTCHFYRVIIRLCGEVFGFESGRVWVFRSRTGWRS